MLALHTGKRADVAALEGLIQMPEGPDHDWHAGFLSGIFDAEGSCSGGILRISNKDEGILSLRGRWFEWRSSDGALELPAMPTLHPAFLLRQPGAKKRAWSDLLTLAERLDRPDRPA